MRPFNSVVLSLVAALAGAAQASVSVSSGGQASYGASMKVPPGIAGMAPNLAFSYADGGLNGPLGVGWSVQGISTISRCPATKPKDGYSRTVYFDGADKLCLDGQRLIQTNASGTALDTQVNDALGLSGSEVREYRTEKDTYARIRAYGAIDGDTTRGPAYFKVWTKSGQIYHYGTFNTDVQALIKSDPSGSGTATIGATWAVSRISDTLGNYIDFKYEQKDTAWGSGPTTAGRVGREWNIKEILYTGTASRGPSNKVVFEYASRQTNAAPGHDISEAYQRAGKNVSTQLLQAVKLYVNTTGTAVAVRNYRLAYERSPVSGRSRLTSLKECAGANDSRCLPATRFTYTNGGSLDSTTTFERSSAFAANALTTLPMTDDTGKWGALAGDFNGDGRTDIIRWGNSAGDNQLHISNGDGSFSLNSNFDIKEELLGNSNGCYYSIVVDVNADALSDILRVAKSSCTTTPSKVFLSAGDGTFRSVDVPASVDFAQLLSRKTRSTEDFCPPDSPYRAVDASRVGSTTTDLTTDPPAPQDELALLTQRRSADATTVASCTKTYRTDGRNYFLIDANGDGFIDILTAELPGYLWYSTWGPEPSETDVCNSAAGLEIDCTSTLYRGNGDGTFSAGQVISAVASMYAHPSDPKDKSNPYWRFPDQADINGDGLQDILSTHSGVWRSNGDGTFTPGAAVEDTAGSCPMPIDFNGDQRADCLKTDSTPTQQALTLQYGATSSANLAQFNLTGTDDALFGRDSEGRQTIGVIAEDFDGDGRTDILRWGQTGAANGIYFSKGDGSFRTPRAAAGLNTIPRPLQATNRKTAFLTGDFLGNGSLQILHLKDSPSNSDPATAESKANQLYVRAGGNPPADVLHEVTASSGLKTTIGARMPLTNASGFYLNDRNTDFKGSGDIVDIQAPLYIIPTVTRETSSGIPLTTRYFYRGLKAQRAGHGVLGFRETMQQDVAPNGDPRTVLTRYLQVYPYIGMASLTATYAGGISSVGTTAQLLSRTANAYCAKGQDATLPEITDPVAPPAPCAVSALVNKVVRPYLYQSIEQGWDLAGKELPREKTTTTYNASVDPLTITVETKGTSLDVEQTFTKTTTSTYFDDDIAEDRWILARVARTSHKTTAPNVLASLSISAGTSPNARDQNGTEGSTPPPPPPPPPQQRTNAGALSAVFHMLLLPTVAPGN